MNLRFDDRQAATKLVKRGGGFVGRFRDDTSRNRNAGFFQQAFRLIFVNLHESIRVSASLEVLSSK